MLLPGLFLKIGEMRGDRGIPMCSSLHIAKVGIGGKDVQFLFTGKGQD